jgi:hypothetical protein
MLTNFENMRLLRVKAGNSKIIRKALADGCKYITPRGKSAEKGPLANGVTTWALLRGTVPNPARHRPRTPGCGHSGGGDSSVRGHHHLGDDLRRTPRGPPMRGAEPSDAPTRSRNGIGVLGGGAGFGFALANAVRFSEFPQRELRQLLGRQILLPSRLDPNEKP